MDTSKKASEAYMAFLIHIGHPDRRNAKDTASIKNTISLDSGQ